MHTMRRDSSTVGWNGLGDDWIAFAQKNESRIHFILPNMLQYLGDVRGKALLDLGCGEGGYARELARRGAQVWAVDCAERAIAYASERAQQEQLSVRHLVRNSSDLWGLESGSFDVVLCSMMLMDCEDLEGTLREIARVLRPGGLLCASVLHPCFNGHYELGIGRQGEGAERQVVVRNYFEPREWSAPVGDSATPVVWRHRTLEEYVKSFVRCGLTMVDLWEPRATAEQARLARTMALLDRVPLYLYWKLQK